MCENVSKKIKYLFSFKILMLFPPLKNTFFDHDDIVPPTLVAKQSVSKIPADASSRCLVVGHVSRGSGELGIGLDDFVDGLEEVLLGGDFPARPYGEHARLRTDRSDLSP